METNALIDLKLMGELREFIIPLAKEEKKQLEANILTNGCRDPLTVWEEKNELILIDGYHRYDICTRHGLNFKINKLIFSDIDEVKLWMINNQLGRRNLTQDQMSYYRGLKYLNNKKTKGGYEYVESKGQNGPSTSEVLSKEFKVSESTVKRDARYAMGMEVVGQSNPALKTKILAGEVKVKKSDIQLLSSYADDKRITIKNEADIYNKAQVIRKRALDEVEGRLDKLHDERVSKAKDTLQEKEPLFLDKDDRLIKLKGRIMSAINVAIKEKDVDAIEQLKELIGLLEQELFG